MIVLIIERLDGHRIGVVTQTLDGSLNTRCDDPDNESELKTLLHDTAKESLVLRKGYTKHLPNGRTSYVTVAKTCQRGDPDYLYALADAISLKKAVIGGKRVWAYAEEVQGSQNV